MMSPPSPGLVASGICHPVPSGMGILSEPVDFLSLLARTIGTTVMDMTTDGVVPEGLIGMPDVSSGKDRFVSPQPSSEWSREKDSAERSVDPATAVVAAAIRAPMGMKVRPYTPSPVSSPPGVGERKTSYLLPSPPVGGEGEGEGDFRSDDPRLAEPFFNLRAMVKPADAAMRIPFEIDQRLTMGRLSEEAGASLVPSEPMVAREALHAATPPANAEIQPVYAGDAPMGMNARTHYPPPPSSRTQGVPEGEGEDGGGSRSEDLRLGDVPSLSSLLPSVEYLAPLEPAVRASYALFAQGAGVTAGPAADLRDPANVPDPAAISAKSQPRLQSEAADVTTSSGRVVLFEDDAAMHPKWDIPQEGEIPDVASGAVNPSPGPQPAARRASAEPSAAVPHSLILPHGSSRTSPAAVAEATTSPIGDRLTGAIAYMLSPASSPYSTTTHETEPSVHFPTPRVPSGCREGVGGEAQDGTSRSGLAQATEQVADPPPSRISMDGRVVAAGTDSREILDHSALLQRVTVRAGQASDRSDLLRSEFLKHNGMSEHVHVELNDHRDAVEQEIPSIADVQDVRQDRSASGFEDGDRLFDHPSSSSGDERQLGSNLACAAPAGGESLRPNLSVPSMRHRVIVDQVAEQIVTAARISLRQEGESVQLRLHPQALGELVVEVSWKDSGITAAIKVHSHVTGELLATDLGRLRIALEEQGFPVSDLGIQVGLDFRQWSYAGSGSHASSTVGYPTEAIHWRDRGSVLPMVSAIAPDSLIDITV